MKSVVLVLFLGVALARFLPHRPTGYTDRHDGYVFEYHIRHYTFLVRNSNNCYLMDVPDQLYDPLMHRDERYGVEDNLLQMIRKGDNLHPTTMKGLMLHHHDALAATECRHHSLFFIDYYPASGN